MALDSDYPVGPFDSGEDDAGQGGLFARLLGLRRGRVGATPPFLPARNAPRSFPATAPAVTTTSAPTYGPLTQQEAARPEAGTLQRLRYDYEHPVEPTQPHGLKAFGEGLLSVFAPRAEEFIQNRRYAPVLSQQNRIAGLEREAQLLAPPSPLDAARLAREQAETNRANVAAQLTSTKLDALRDDPRDKGPRIEGGQAIFTRPDGTVYAKPIEGFQAPGPHATGKFVNAEGHEIQVYSDGSTKDLGAAQPHAAGRGVGGGKGGPRTEGVTPGMKAGAWLKRMGF